MTQQSRTTERIQHACREFDWDCVACLQQRVKDQDEAIDEFIDAEDRVRALRDDWLERIRRANEAERAKMTRFRRPGWVGALVNRVQELDDALGYQRSRSGGAS